MRKLLFVVTEDWAFCTHRIALAKEAMQSGFKVVVAARELKHKDVIEEAGIKFIPLKMLRRDSFNIFQELAAILELKKIYHQEKPDIIHHVAMKPIIYGSVAAKLAGIKKQVQAIAGFGFVFTSKTLKAKLLKLPVRLLLTLSLKGSHTHVIVQNEYDKAIAKKLGVAHIHMIEGSGVNTHDFPVTPEPKRTVPVITLVSRILRDKGIVEFIEALRILKQKQVPFNALLVGEPDTGNPTSILRAEIEGWQKEGLVTWLGRRNDVSQLWQDTNIAVLPSYREGLPKSLLEAAACARAMVATDVPGCNAIVVDQDTGLLVPARNALALAEALQILIDDERLRRDFGKKARLLVEERFSDQIVNTQIIALYSRLIQEPA